MFHFYNYYHSLLLCTITLFFYLSTNCVLSVFIKRILELELEFLLAVHINDGRMVYHFGDKTRYCSKINFFLNPPAFDAPVREVPGGILQ